MVELVSQLGCRLKRAPLGESGGCDGHDYMAEGLSSPSRSPERGSAVPTLLEKRPRDVTMLPGMEITKTESQPTESVSLPTSACSDGSDEAEGNEFRIQHAVTTSALVTRPSNTARKKLNRFWLPLGVFRRYAAEPVVSMRSSTSQFARTMAEITFNCGSSPFCKISPSADPNLLYEEVILPVWGLPPPNLILSIMGGAGNMQLDEQPFDAGRFSQGLVEAAVRTGAWVITGGTKSGVMDLVGKAMKQHDKRRQVTCIGICPFWGLTTRWRKALRRGRDHTMVVDAAEAESKEGEAPECDGNIRLTEPQDNHTHFIMVDNSKAGGKIFGSESAFRAEFESCMACGKYSESCTSEVFDWPVASKSGSQSPRVMILLNGGKISLESMMAAIKLGCPVVLCEGTGRLSDLLCTVLRNVQEDPDQDIYSLFAGAKELHMATEELTDNDLDMATFIIRSGFVHVYSHTQRLQDVIMRAVLSGTMQAVDTGRKLLLAAQWCCAHYFDVLGRQLVLECTAEHGAQGCSKAIEFIFRHIVGGATTAKDQQMEAKPRSAVVTWLLTHHHKRVKEFKITAENLGRIEWNQLGGGTLGLEGLLLWSVEREAPASVLKAIWMQMEDPVHSALIAAHASRQTARLKHSSSSFTATLRFKQLNVVADGFENLALLLLDEIAKTGRGVDYLFKEAKNWKSVTSSCFHLAHQLQCKKFVAATFYIEAVDRFWMTPAPFDLRKQQLDQKYLNPVSFMGLLLYPGTVGFTRWQLLSIPAIKMYTHGIMRLLLIGIYSYAVFCSKLAHTGIIQPIKVVLFLWGLGLAKIEISQVFHKDSFWHYISDPWNVLDTTTISLLLGALVLGGFFLADANPETNTVEHMLEVIHALGVLLSWIRLLQHLLVHRYFGTLLITISNMVKEALCFFVMQSIICLAFSCALTPMLFVSSKDREDQGLLWGFWLIVNEDSLEPLRGQAKIQKSVPLRYLIQLLLYAVAFSNVLIVDLLIALMNSTYERNQAASEADMGYRRINFVLEWESEFTLPPPLNLLESFESSETLPSRMSQSLDSVINRRDLEDAQKRALVAVSQEGEDLGEAASLRAEIAELKRANAQLGNRNTELERMAADYLLQSQVSRVSTGDPRKSPVAQQQPQLSRLSSVRSALAQIQQT